jgi:copper(I)-binding protein
MTSTASSMAGEPKAGAIYLTLVNAGAADTLTGASIEAAGALELHVTEVRGGVAMMRPVLSIAVPARGEVELQPGADHLMLLNVRRELRPGDTFQLVLTFVKAGRVEVTAQVRGRQAASTGH